MCSIVKYEIHFLESILYSSINAFVGQTIMQSLQLPQLSISSLSDSIFMGRKISLRNNHDPYFLETIFVCFPCHPSPAFCARGFSNTGAVSTNVFTFNFR